MRARHAIAAAAAVTGSLLLTVGCSSSNSSSSASGNTGSGTNWATASSSAGGGGMNALVAAARVAAKRYLCASQPGYIGLLSAESVRTLALQGGPEFGHFEALLTALLEPGPLSSRGVRDSALTATELRTLNATAPPR